MSEQQNNKVFHSSCKTSPRVWVKVRAQSLLRKDYTYMASICNSPSPSLCAHARLVVLVPLERYKSLLISNMAVQNTTESWQTWGWPNLLPANFFLPEQTLTAQWLPLFLSLRCFSSPCFFFGPIETPTCFFLRPAHTYHWVLLNTGDLKPPAGGKILKIPNAWKTNHLVMQVDSSYHLSLILKKNSTK